MRIALADDSACRGRGPARALGAAGFAVFGQAGDAVELLAIVAETYPMWPWSTSGCRRPTPTSASRPPTSSGHDTRRSACSCCPGTADRLCREAAVGGDRGARLPAEDRVSHLEELEEAIRRVGSGETVVDPDVVSRLVTRRRERGPLQDLTERERSVLAFMAEGRSNGAISEQLVLSGRTVESTAASIFSNLGLPVAGDDHRRVLAVVNHLRAPP